MSRSPVSATDLEQARERIAPYVVRTPLTRAHSLGARLGYDLWLKEENQQHTGSFKPRGALNKLLAMGSSARAGALVAASAGNHALGVAYACEQLNLPGTHLFVQANAGRSKLQKLTRFAVHVHLVGHTYEEAAQAAMVHAREHESILITAYDDVAVIAGHGTCGLEIVEDLDEIDAVVIPVGGGALSAGIAVAVKARNPGTRVIGVNPEASPSAFQSFAERRALDPFEHQPTIAHGIAGGYGRTPYAVARDLIDEIVLVSDEEITAAMAALSHDEKIQAEPSGAAAVAALLAGKIGDLRGNVVAVVSGGNIDAQTLRSLIA